MSNNLPRTPSGVVQTSSMQYDNGSLMGLFYNFFGWLGRNWIGLLIALILIVILIAIVSWFISKQKEAEREDYFMRARKQKAIDARTCKRKGVDYVRLFNPTEQRQIVRLHYLGDNYDADNRQHFCVAKSKKWFAFLFPIALCRMMPTILMKPFNFVVDFDIVSKESVMLVPDGKKKQQIIVYCSGIDTMPDDVVMPTFKNLKTEFGAISDKIYWSKAEKTFKEMDTFDIVSAQARKNIRSLEGTKEFQEKKLEAQAMKPVGVQQQGV